jgi:hypothetical protein
MNIAPNSTIAVPLKAVKREIKYASKLGARAAQGDLNVVRLLNVVQEGQVRRNRGGLFFFHRFARARPRAQSCTAVRSGFFSFRLHPDVAVRRPCPFSHAFAPFATHEPTPGRTS